MNPNNRINLRIEIIFAPEDFDTDCILFQLAGTAFAIALHDEPKKMAEALQSAEYAARQNALSTVRTIFYTKPALLVA